MTKAATLTISPVPIPPGQVSLPYAQQLTASGGTPPYLWRISSGALPFGLQFSSGGLLSGTVAGPSTSTFTVQVQDSATPPNTGQQPYRLNFAYGQVAITTTSLPSGTQGSGYSATLQAAGGDAPYTWTNPTGALPAGLSLTPAGVLQGTPSSVQTCTFKIEVQDSATPPSNDQAPFTVSIVTPPPPPPPPPRPPIRMCVGDPSLEAGPGEDWETKDLE